MIKAVDFKISVDDEAINRVVSSLTSEPRKMSADLRADVRRELQLVAEQAFAYGRRIGAAEAGEKQ